MSVNSYRKGLTLFSPISASAANPIAGTISSSLGVTAFSLTGVYFLACSATVEGKEYRNLVADLSSLVSGMTASYNPQMQSVRLKRATPITVAAASGSFAARVLGMTGGVSYSAVAEFSSTVSPVNLWKSQYAERSKWTRPYEPASFYFDHEADDGTTYSIGRSSTAIFSDWSFELEPKRKVWRDAATSEEPYPLQTFISDVRADKPFIVLGSAATASLDFSGTKEGIYRLRAEGSFFKPRFKDVNYHNHVHLDFKTRVLSGGVG